ncbi:MAG: 3-oxoacyl-[acyl-carrier protein] reductase [Planctomycetota bacterium]|jgi:3-oxoacyl-[acyl-carrier protein] reductase
MKSRTYLIVGAHSAIANHSIQDLLQSGHRVIAVSRSSLELPTSERLETYLYDPEDSEAELNLPEELDGLVYFPGTITLKPFGRLTEQDFLHDYRVNVLGAVRVIQQALPSLKKSTDGSIVLFSSVAATIGLGFHASIAAAKAGVEGLGRSLAAELAPGIRVNMIAPSLTDTPLASPLLSTDERRAAAANRHPLKKIGGADDVAALVSFLLSEKAQFITGQVLRPDGGLSSARVF